MVNGKFKSILLLFTVCFLCNCSLKHELKNKEVIPQVVGKYHIKTDTSLLEYYSLFQVFSTLTFDGLIGFNHFTRSLDFINLHSGIKEYALRLDELGHNIPPGFGDFYYHNYDSIFFCYDEYRLLCLNARTGKILNYNLKNEILCLVEPVMGFKLEYIRENNVLQFNAPYYSELFKIIYYRTPIVGEFNISEDSLIIRYGFHPAKYHYHTKHYPIMSLPSKVNYKGKCIVSFCPDHNIYFYNRSIGNLQFKSFCKSDFVGKVNPIKRKSDFQLVADYLTTTPFYYKILINAQEGFLYRLVKGPQQLYNKLGKLNQRWTGPWSIVLFDLSEYKVIGEAQFLQEEYNYRFSFITREGLCVARQTHDPGDLITFDILTFSIFP